MKKIKSDMTSLEQSKEKYFGKRGTPKREQHEAGYEFFKIGVFLHEARLEKGLTQGELAQKVGKTKSYISRIENDVKEVRTSTLREIVEKWTWWQAVPVDTILISAEHLRSTPNLPDENNESRNLNCVTFCNQNSQILPNELSYTTRWRKSPAQTKQMHQGIGLVPIASCI